MKLPLFQNNDRIFHLSRHINTVDLQMEVTKFLHQCESSGTPQMTGSSLPTLFGNNNMKMDVACKVLIAIPNTALFFINNINWIYRLKCLVVGAASCIFHGQVTCAYMQPTVYEKFMVFCKVAGNVRTSSSSTQISNFQMQGIPNTNSNRLLMVHPIVL